MNTSDSLCKVMGTTLYLVVFSVLACFAHGEYKGKCRQCRQCDRFEFRDALRGDGGACLLGFVSEMGISCCVATLIMRIVES